MPQPCLQKVIPFVCQQVASGQCGTWQAIVEPIVVVHSCPSLNGKQCSGPRNYLVGYHVSSSNTLSLQMTEKLRGRKAKPYLQLLSVLARMNFVFLGRKELNLIDLPSGGWD